MLLICGGWLVILGAGALIGGREGDVQRVKTFSIRIIRVGGVLSYLGLGVKAKFSTRCECHMTSKNDDATIS